MVHWLEGIFDKAGVQNSHSVSDVCPEYIHIFNLSHHSHIYFHIEFHKAVISSQKSYCWFNAEIVQISFEPFLIANILCGESAGWWQKHSIFEMMKYELDFILWSLKILHPHQIWELVTRLPFNCSLESRCEPSHCTIVWPKKLVEIFSWKCDCLVSWNVWFRLAIPYNLLLATCHFTYMALIYYTAPTKHCLHLKAYKRTRNNIDQFVVRGFKWWGFWSRNRNRYNSYLQYFMGV